MEISPTDTHLHVQGLRFSYRGPHRTTNAAADIFHDFDFRCSAGQKLWLRGDSGAGKSTFLKLVAGLLLPHAGTIVWGSFSMNSANEAARASFRKSNIAFGDQDLHLVESWTVLQNLELVSKEPKQIAQILQEVGLQSFSERSVRTLSGGQKQKVLVARVILQNPRIVLLDEPTAHLDDTNTAQVMTALQKHFAKATVIVVSHDQRLEKWIPDVAYLGNRK